MAFQARAVTKANPLRGTCHLRALAMMTTRSTPTYWPPGCSGCRFSLFWCVDDGVFSIYHYNTTVVKTAFLSSMDGVLFSLTALDTQIGVSISTTAREVVYTCLAGALTFHICASRCFSCCHPHYIQSMHSYTWLFRVVRTDPLPDHRRCYKGWRHHILGSRRNSTGTASSTKDCMRVSAPARLAHDISATREISVRFRSPPGLSVFGTPVVSFDALLLHHPLSHRIWVYFGAHWYTCVYVGWLANAGWYLLYRFFGCQSRCRRVGDCVGCRRGLSCVLYTQHENIDVIQYEAFTWRASAGLFTNVTFFGKCCIYPTFLFSLYLCVAYLRQGDTGSAWQPITDNYTSCSVRPTH